MRRSRSILRQAGETATAGTIDLGPLSLQGPTVGIADFGFKDGMVVLTIAVGVNLATLQFGDRTPAPAGSRRRSSKSGVQVNLLGVLGTFDIAVDVFGLLSGNFRVELPGKWSFSVAVARGHRARRRDDHGRGHLDQVRPGQHRPATRRSCGSTRRSIQFQQFAVRGSIEHVRSDRPNDAAGDEIPGLRIRKNGFDLGVLELCYGCTAADADDAGRRPPGQTATTTTGSTTAKISIGGIIEFDDIRFIVENFSFTVGASVSFDGSIAIASGGARFFPGKPFNATITDRVAADDHEAERRRTTPRRCASSSTSTPTARSGASCSRSTR